MIDLPNQFANHVGRLAACLIGLMTISLWLPAAKVCYGIARFSFNINLASGRS